MLTITPPSDVRRALVAERLKRVWRPDDWFKLDDRVAGHYAWKSAVLDAAVNSESMFVDYEASTLWLVEIGVRCGYSLHAFGEAASSHGLDIDALCFDAYLDDDSPRCRDWVFPCGRFNDHGIGEGIGEARLVVANTRHLLALPAAGFAHVDGEHTDTGVVRDLRLVDRCGTILVDDCDNPQVMKGVREWLGDHPDRECQFLDDGLRTLGVITRVPTGNQG